MRKLLPLVLPLAGLLVASWSTGCKTYTLNKVNELNMENTGTRRTDLNYGFRYKKKYCALPDNISYNEGDSEFKATRILGMGNWYLHIVAFPSGGFGQASSVQFEVEASDHTVTKAWFFMVQKAPGKSPACGLLHLVRCSRSEPYCTSYISEYKGGDNPKLPRGPVLKFIGKKFSTPVRSARDGK